ncbi:eukaryotic translation initiation factor 4 gamma 2-like [Cervus elaphus]|uniref:eukaryotic translation initiation factor 4 gamma 2-like n=1 Tax=Cervus elaphus TaxID=9860 RepID=UPI001CC29A17|nr:eukaryotic translation initiation factor 4 gamma 2-like [Cervus elaphus]
MVGLLDEKRQYGMWGVEAEHGDVVIPSMFEEKGPTGSRSWFMLVVISPMSFDPEIKRTLETNVSFLAGVSDDLPCSVTGLISLSVCISALKQPAWRESSVFLDLPMARPEPLRMQRVFFEFTDNPTDCVQHKQRAPLTGLAAVLSHELRVFLLPRRSPGLEKDTEVRRSVSSSYLLSVGKMQDSGSIKIFPELQVSKGLSGVFSESRFPSLVFSLNSSHGVDKTIFLHNPGARGVSYNTVIVTNSVQDKLDLRVKGWHGEKLQGRHNLLSGPLHCFAKLFEYQPLPCGYFTSFPPPPPVPSFPQHETFPHVPGSIKLHLYHETISAYPIPDILTRLSASSESELYGGGGEYRVVAAAATLPSCFKPVLGEGFSFLPSSSLPTPSINIILLKILRCQAAKVESAIAEGGASRFSASSGGGGRRGAPQHYPKTAGNSEFLGKTAGQKAQKWIPPRSTRRDDNSAANNSANEKEQHDAIFRKVRGILNKLTPEKFDKLCLELLNVGVESKLILKGVILLIVDKALEEPKYSSLYAQLCLRLAEDAPNFDGPAAEGQPGQKQSTTFRRLLISKLQDEFENRTRNVDVYDKRENPLLPEEEEQRAIAKIKMLGNIKFIGELGKLDLIHESILHKCIKTLLEKKKRVQLKDMGEDLECLCQIMRTVGPRLDHERAKSLMDQYFARMCSLMLSKELPARIRFLLQDTLELREHHWVPRKAFLDNGPKTINQIRQDAVKDLGVFIPAPMAQGMRSDFFLEGPFMPPRMKMDRDPLGGLADMFGQMPGSGIGTGPGVIQDRFSPTMGRHRSNQLFNGHGGHIMPPTQSQFGEMGGKFMKSQISLRPAQSFLMNKNQVPKLQPQITMIPPSAQPPRTQTPPLGQTPQLGLKTNPPLIQEKPAKTSKKPPPSKEELLKLTETVVTEYLNSGNANEAVNGVREMRAPKHFLPEMLSKVIILSLDRSDEDKEKASSLISLLKQEGIATSDNFTQAFLNVLDQCPKLEVDIPLVKSYLAQFAVRAIISELVSISELAQPLESGTHFPLFLLCLQQLAKLQDREWLTELFQQSKVNMQKMLPEIDQNKDRMLEILEGKGLSFLFPLLKWEKELLKQIKLDPSPQTIYKWIKDNISPKLHVDKGFVNILMTSFLQYISSEVNPPSDETDSSSAPSKEQLEQEKQLLLSFKPVMQKFLHDHVDLQVSALYALQVHCYNSNFPKGMLLRFFVHFYDMEIIEEEAFLAWKEDITQEFPGKGKALFQVNQWLTWLETAEEEESEEEAD